MEALVRLLRQAAPDDLLRGRRERPRAAAQRRWVLLQDRREGVRGGLPLERPAPREHLVQDRPQREQVGARVGCEPSCLLGGQVPEGSQDDAIRGPGVVGGRGGGAAGLQALVARELTDSFPLAQLRQAEVQDLHPAVGGEEHVLRLQVPVHEPTPVRRLETPTHLPRRPRRRGASAADHARAGREASPPPAARTPGTGDPFSCPTSWTVSTFGCDSAATARASRSNRSRRSGSGTPDERTTFTATSRPSRGSRAR